MGIFPIVGAGFFVYYLGLPPEFQIAGITIPTTLPLMLILVGSAVAICFHGGQVTLIITDFLQSIFVNIMLVVIVFFAYKMFTWDQVKETFISVENTTSLVNPYSKGASDFSIWFFLINAFWMFYNVVSWSPNTMQVSSARDAQEARMLRVFVQIKNFAMIGLGLFILPLAVFVIMNHHDFSSQASAINATLTTIDNQQVQSQMITPTAIKFILPTGLLGAFGAVVLFAFISTHDTYLLAWGGLLIQDVIIPLKKKELSPHEHMKWIKRSVLAVAVFIVIFSSVFRQVDNIFMFFDISASLYIGAAGVVLLGSLYWKHGTTQAACATMITGCVLSIGGFIYRQINPDFLDGRVMSFYIVLICIAEYFSVSMLTRKKKIAKDMIQKDIEKIETQKTTIYYVGKTDRILIRVMLCGISLFIAALIGLGIYSLKNEISATAWLSFWRIFIMIMFCIGTSFLVWITIGGIIDLKKLFKALKTSIIDVEDDGRVE
jgi:SSS family solute:Na+ symporter